MNGIDAAGLMSAYNQAAANAAQIYALNRQQYQSEINAEYNSATMLEQARQMAFDADFKAKEAREQASRNAANAEASYAASGAQLTGSPADFLLQQTAKDETEINIQLQRDRQNISTIHDQRAMLRGESQQQSAEARRIITQLKLSGKNSFMATAGAAMGISDVDIIKGLAKSDPALNKIAKMVEESKLAEAQAEAANERAAKQRQKQRILEGIDNDMNLLNSKAAELGIGESYIKSAKDNYKKKALEKFSLLGGNQ